MQVLVADLKAAIADSEQSISTTTDEIAALEAGIMNRVRDFT